MSILESSWPVFSFLLLTLIRMWPKGGALAEPCPSSLLCEGSREGRTQAALSLEESHCHWLTRGYKYSQMAITGSERAETPGETASRQATRRSSSTFHADVPLDSYFFILYALRNQWRRDGRVRNFLWNPPWIPVRVWSVRSWWWGTASAGRLRCFTCLPRTVFPR